MIERLWNREMCAMNLALLKSLSELAGIPGREERVRDLLKKQCKDVFDEVSVDAMGNLIATKRAKHKNGNGGGSSKAKRVLLACHIDEIGFYVRHVDDKGFVRVQPAGGFDVRNLFARRVMIQSSGGEDLYGLLNPSGRPTHIAKDEEKKKIPEMTDFFIDLCLPPEQVK